MPHISCSTVCTLKTEILFYKSFYTNGQVGWLVYSRPSIKDELIKLNCHRKWRIIQYNTWFTDIKYFHFVSNIPNHKELRKKRIAKGFPCEQQRQMGWAHIKSWNLRAGATVLFHPGESLFQCNVPHQMVFRLCLLENFNMSFLYWKSNY